jgi:protein-disulfide isomerase-like protein with CxxC motif
MQKLSGNPVWEAAFEQVFNIALCGSTSPEKWAVSRWTSSRHERLLAIWVAMQRTLYHQGRMTPSDVQRFEVSFLSCEKHSL